MTEQDYMLELEKLQDRITEKNAVSVLKQLEGLYEIKPVRLKWFIVKAKALLAAGHELGEIYGFLDSKGAGNLHDYAGLRELYDFYAELSEMQGDSIDAARHHLYSFLLDGGLTEKSKKYDFVDGVYRRHEKNKKNFLDGGIGLEALADSYYITGNDVMYFMVSLLLERQQKSFCWRASMLSMDNVEFIRETINSQRKIPCILVVDSEKNIDDYNVLLEILSMLQQKVYCIAEPIKYSVGNWIDLKETVSLSLENVEEEDNITLLHSIGISCQGEYLGDNRAFLIEWLTEEVIEGHLALLLTSGAMMDTLSQIPCLMQKLERMTSVNVALKEEIMSFGWVGDYLSYIDIVHNMDTLKAIVKEPECEYSIVIPARNSGYSLRYTIMTCLNQRYNDGYEVIISDNSSSDNDEIRILCEELQDSRIRYLRTPKEYNLSKSFEYAFLNTKGKFILSLGSDDALLPWTLEILTEIRKQNPKEDLIVWERGFYAWPGFNGGQENQFVIPRKYEKNKCSARYISCQDYLELIQKDVENMYLLPMLYINSGFKRGYMKKILAGTGRLWDGIGQDIYIGIINALINKNVLYVFYPLAIAGMTGTSAGARSEMPNRTTDEDFKSNLAIKQLDNVSRFKTSYIERLAPEVSTGISCLYNSILRAAARGLIDRKSIINGNVFNWKEVFEKIAGSQSKSDIVIDRKMQSFRYSASLHGKEFLEWFEEKIYPKIMSPEKITEIQVKQELEKKKYVTGPIEGGGCILDASEYGVRDIYSASLLFEKITGL